MRCREYSVPPSHGVPARVAYIGTLEPGQIFGPVLNVELYCEFVSVQVPSTMSGLCGTLVWVNIENHGQQFARMVYGWCRAQGCGAALNRRQSDTYRICSDCERAIFSNNDMKTGLVHAFRRRKRMISQLFRARYVSTYKEFFRIDFETLHSLQLEHVLRIVLSYVGEDLGRLKPSFVWRILLRVSGYFFECEELSGGSSNVQGIVTHV